MRTPEDFHRIIDFLLETISWNPHAKCLIYMDKEQTDEEMRSITVLFMREIWKHYVINVTIMVPMVDGVDYIQRVCILKKMFFVNLIR